MKTVCYTALAGAYDTLRDPTYVSKNWDYICFTDQPLKRLGVWKLRPLQKVIKEDAVRTNRWHKTHPHLLFPEYHNSIYIDANIQITGDHLESRLKQFLADGALTALSPHPRRHCVYDEIRECLLAKLDCPLRIRNMEQLLHNSGFPHAHGLFENNLIIRRHNHPAIIKLNTEWWNLLVQYSRRDQLSLPYLLWKHRLEALFILPGGADVRNYPGYHYMPHNQPLVKTPLRRKLARFAAILIPVKHWRHAVRRFLNRK